MHAVIKFLSFCYQNNCVLNDIVIGLGSCHGNVAGVFLGTRSSFSSRDSPFSLFERTIS